MIAIWRRFVAIIGEGLRRIAIWRRFVAIIGEGLRMIAIWRRFVAIIGEGLRRIVSGRRNVAAVVDWRRRIATVAAAGDQRAGLVIVGQSAAGEDVAVKLRLAVAVYLH